MVAVAPPEVVILLLRAHNSIRRYFAPSPRALQYEANKVIEWPLGPLLFGVFFGENLNILESLFSRKITKEAIRKKLPPLILQTSVFTKGFYP